MKCTIPEIAWHNRDPVLSVDIQLSKGQECFYRLATGGTDSHVLIWLVSVEKVGVSSIECAADLTRHTRPVNCVRFSPSGDLLASGDDEACVMLWKMKTSNDPPELSGGEEESFKEQWTSVKVLRGHLQDVYDLSWSADSKNLITGSVDNTAILWDIPSGKNLGILTEHKGFVQGVAWDPCGQYVATLSSDRVCRVYNTTSRRVVSKMYKGYLPGRSQELETKPAHYFHDDTLKSFFRRLTFSPDGNLLIVPSGLVEEPDKKSSHSTIIFHRNCLQKPIMYLPSLSQYSVAVRCCPVYFTLRPMDSPPLFQLPYRVVIAIATQSSVLLYDTQHSTPFAYITNIHYTRLTDLSWSSDGRVLVVSSTDGYCSVITFAENELGTVYTGENKQDEVKTPTESKLKVADEIDQPSSLKEKYVDTLSLSEDANMSFEESGIKRAESVMGNVSNSLKENVLSKKEDLETGSDEKEGTAMEVDNFSLVYEGTVTDSVLEPKMDVKTKVNETTCDKPIENSKHSSEDSQKYIIEENADISESSSTKLPPTDNIPRTLESEKMSEENSATGSIKSSEMPIKEKTPTKASDANKGLQEEMLSSPKSGISSTPSSNKKTPRRVQLITLSSPKSKKKLLE